jgi:hypothetical protein
VRENGDDIDSEFTGSSPTSENANIGFHLQPSNYAFQRLKTKQERKLRPIKATMSLEPDVIVILKHRRILDLLKIMLQLTSAHLIRIT